MQGQKKSGTISFADYELSRRGYRNETLERLNALVDWESFRTVLSTIYASTGRHSYDPVVMLKALILQILYSLSDRELENSLADRISFQRFLGIAIDDDIPDFTTLCRFRNQLAKRGLAEKLFQRFSQLLDARGMSVKKGVMVDATLIESAAKRPSKKKKSKDIDARWGGKGGHQCHGSKAHISVDADTGFILDVEVTAANVHDTKVFEELLPPETEVVLADSAYRSKARERWLQEHGIASGISEKGCRHKKLTDEQRHRNRKLAEIRNAVERPFATLKRIFKLRRAWYVGIERVTNQFRLAFLAMNMKKLCVLSL